jgi:hypothetical protein
VSSCSSFSPPPKLTPCRWLSQEHDHKPKKDVHADGKHKKDKKYKKDTHEKEKRHKKSSGSDKSDSDDSSSDSDSD